MSRRNPDLPILDELGAEFAALVESAYGEGTDRHAARRRPPLSPPRRSRERGAQARRIGRRATVVLVLVCLVGGVAFAALRGGSGDRAHTSPTLLGRDGSGAWSFSVYRDGGRLCTIFAPRGGELGGSCGPAPGRGRLRAGSAIVAGHRYVFGVSGPGVARATASPAGADAGRDTERTGAAAIHRPVDRAAASAAGFPTGDGWFVLDLGPIPQGGEAVAPAVVTPLTRSGRRAGPPYVDCSLGALARACVRRIESAARG